jgi:hypothetical protein
MTMSTEGWESIILQLRRDLEQLKSLDPKTRNEGCESLSDLFLL